jgi:hypothetical protein
MGRRICLEPLVLELAGREAFAAEYKRLCEASAAVYIDARHFVVASDETNRLQIYQRGQAKPIDEGVDLEDFTSFDKSDLEAAARIGDRIYWISSHSYNRAGEDVKKRQLFLATRIVSKKGEPGLVPVGRPVTTLRDAIAKAAGVAKSALNIEALAATPKGGLLIGLRAPLRDGKAIVLPFTNPAAVVDTGAAPDFGPVELLDLDEGGLRSMDLVGKGRDAYAIVAGSVRDKAEGFAVFRWSGPGGKPRRIADKDLKGLTPEALMAVPNEGVLQILSDDGDISRKETKPKKQRFRSIVVRA